MRPPLLPSLTRPATSRWLPSVRSRVGSAAWRTRSSVPATIQTRTFLDVVFHLLNGANEPDPNRPIAEAQRNYPRLTAAATALKHKRTPPRECAMLARDFVDDALYHPQYGYFSKQATIFTVTDHNDLGFDFQSCRDSLEFMNSVGERYGELEGDLNDVNDNMRQVWHTPTELFKPWYGYAIAKHIVTEYKLSSFPHEDLILYEIGAGNGTLMLNILDYLREREPAVYERTRYNIIEISAKLASQQAKRHALRGAAHSHGDRIRIINKSIFDWDTPEPNPCFFIAMEVVDNFAHDVIRYDVATGQPMQAVVLTDKQGRYVESYEPVNDPLIQRYLMLRHRVGYRSPAQQRMPLHRLRQYLPLAPNLTPPEFLPTKALLLLEQLRQHFPRHRLVLSDFFTLPDAVPGLDAPVVQTRYRQTMVPCSTYLVQPGWFDIFYPTNFELLCAIYQLICQTNGARVLSQRDFLTRFGELEQTTTKSGENPMLSYYENNKFLLS